MKQYVLTRSAFPPIVWDGPANRRRLRVTAAVTARLLGAQTITDWTWVVVLDERDPLLPERLRLYGDSVPCFCPIVWRPPSKVLQGAARASVRPGSRSAYAVALHSAPWRSVIPSDDTVLMARLDTDDGFAPDALERFRAAAEGLTKRTILMLPAGIWTYRGTYARVRHDVNAMHTLVTPPGDVAVPYGYSHVRCREFAPVVTVDDRLGWLWTRHGDTISAARSPQKWGGTPKPLDAATRAAFPIDWSALARM